MGAEALNTFVDTYIGMLSFFSNIFLFFAIV